MASPHRASQNSGLWAPENSGLRDPERQTRCEDPELEWVRHRKPGMGGGLGDGAGLSRELLGLTLESVHHRHPVHHLILPFCIPPRPDPGEGGAVCGAASILVSHAPSALQHPYLHPQLFSGG